jgi:hypothetical protein
MIQGKRKGRYLKTFHINFKRIDTKTRNVHDGGP